MNLVIFLGRGGVKLPMPIRAALRCCLWSLGPESYRFRNSGDSMSETPEPLRRTKYSKWHFPAEKSVDFPLGVADICRKLCDLRSQTQIPPSRGWKNNRRIL